MAQSTDGAAPARQRPDMREMLMMHRVFRRDIAGGPRLIRSVAPGDVERAGRVADHLRLALLILDLHHTGEDEYIWPLLLERAPTDASLVHTMESQHAAVAGGMVQAREQLDRWAVTADPADGEQVAATLTALTAAMLEHLDAEEAHVLSLIETYVTADEWGQLGRHGMAGVSEEQRPIVIGMLTEDLPDDERAAFVANLPPPVQQLWLTAWAPAYADYVKAVREPA